MTALPRDWAEGRRTAQAYGAKEARREPPGWEKLVAGRQRAARGGRWGGRFLFPGGAGSESPPGQLRARDTGTGKRLEERQEGAHPGHGYGIRGVKGHGQEGVAG